MGTLSLGETRSLSQVAISVARSSHSCRTCSCSKFYHTPTVSIRSRLRTSLRVVPALWSGVSQRPVPVPAAVAEQDFATQASEGTEDSSQVQTLLQWLAIQGSSI